MLDSLKNIFSSNKSKKNEDLLNNSLPYQPPKFILELLDRYQTDGKELINELKNNQLLIVNERVKNTKLLINKHISKTKKMETLQGLISSINRHNVEIKKYTGILKMHSTLLILEGNQEFRQYINEVDLKIKDFIKLNEDEISNEPNILKLEPISSSNGLDKIGESEFYSFLSEYEENINYSIIEKIEVMIDRIEKDLSIEETNTIEETKTIEIEINPNTKVQLPENLKQLFSIWNSNDKQTVIDIYDKYKEYVKPTGINGNAKRGEKKRLFCLANELYKKKWIKCDGVATYLAEVFNMTFGFKHHTDDYNKYQFESESYKFDNSLIKEFVIPLNESNNTVIPTNNTVIQPL